MDISYVRQMDRNYMVVDSDQITGEEYALKMLEKNTPSALLSVKTSRLNGNVRLCYDITSRQPISQVFEKLPLGEEDLRRILSDISISVDECRRFLLDPSGLLLRPEYIYMDLADRSIRLVYFPFQTEPGDREPRLQALSEFILKHLDHSQQEAVNLGYGFYELAAGDNINLPEVIGKLLHSHDGVRSREAGTQEKAGPGVCISPENSSDDILAGVHAYAEYDERRRRSSDKKNRSERKRKQSGRKNRYNSGAECQSDGGKGRHRGAGCMSDGAEGRPGGTKGRPDTQTDSAVKRILPVLITTLISAAVYASAVWWFCLDLTQAGGLAFLMLALIWLIYSLMDSGRQKGRNQWYEEEIGDADDEDAFMEALISEVYDRNDDDNRRQMTGGGETGRSFLRDMGGRKDYPEERGGPAVESRLWHSGAESRNEGRKAQSAGTAYAQIQGMAEGSGEYGGTSDDGQTRCLSMGDENGELILRLASQDLRRCQDLYVRSMNAVIGKKKEQVDLYIPLDTISRMHAKIEYDGKEWWITDLNSMNGTFIDGERLAPNEKRVIRKGTQISFATLAFRVS